MSELRTDFENLPDGQAIMVYPNSFNPLKKKPHKVTYNQGYFYSDNPIEGPDYYFRDFLTYNDGFEVIQ